MEPEDFLKQAKRLINSNNPSEVEFRSAISRAYYSLYHESMISLKTSRHKKLLSNKVREHLKKYPPKNRQIDEKLINDIYTPHLHFLGVPLHYIVRNALQDIDCNIGMDFMSYHLDRKVADYELNRKFSHRDSDVIVKGIEDLIIHIKEKLQAS